MEIDLRKEKRRTHAVGCVWKRFVVFMVLLGVVFSTSGCLEKPKDTLEVPAVSIMDQDVEYSDDGDSNIDSDYILEEFNCKEEKEEIASFLLSCFDITRDQFQSPPYIESDPNLDKLYKRMEKPEDSHYMYIDLIGCTISNNIKLCDYDYNHAKNMLKRIGGIRCNRLYINKISFELVGPLIERMVIENQLTINYSDWAFYSFTCLIDYIIEKPSMDAFLELDWCDPMKIPHLWIFNSSANVVMERVFGYISNYEIANITITEHNLQNLDLRIINVMENSSITVEKSKCIENIFLPEKNIRKYDSITLKCLPKFQRITNLFTKQIDTLSLSINVFITLKKEHLDEINASEDRALRIKKLDLKNVAYTFREPSDISPPWIYAETVELCNECCTRCDRFGNVRNPNYFLTMIKTLGVSTQPESFVCKNISSNWSELVDTSISLRDFIQAIGNTIIQPEDDAFKCPAKFYNYRVVPISLEIHLKNYDAIQKAIKEFEEHYNILSIHIYYSRIVIYGSGKAKKDFIILVGIFTCIGPRVKADALLFYNMKGFNGLNDAQEEDLLRMEIPQTQFDLKKLYFYRSKDAFIRRVFTEYIYSSISTLYIDCYGIKQENIISLTQDMVVKYKISQIALRNAFTILVDVLKENCLMNGRTMNKVSLVFGKSDHQVRLYDITLHMSSKNSVFSSIFLSTLLEISQATSIKSRKKRKVFEFQVEKSVEKSCLELTNCPKPIFLITELTIAICESSPALTTPVVHLCALVKKLREIFVDVEVVHISNLWIKQEEEASLNDKLFKLIDEKNEYKLKKVSIKGCKIVVEEKEDLAVGGKKHSIIAEKKEPQTQDYLIEKEDLNKIVKRILKEKNVCISYLANLFVLKKYDKVVPGIKIEHWEKDIIYNTACIVCMSSFQKTKERYIIRHCMHSICLDCIKGWYQAKPNGGCPLCRGPADFNKDFFFICSLFKEEKEKIEEQQVEVDKKTEETSSKSNELQKDLSEEETLKCYREKIVELQKQAIDDNLTEEDFELIENQFL
ncbi:hypothetical protein NEFER03_1941 [Nematocida sp. LUAm3]|nr:hypothetical protein NEFER03_1941 [Nematocida sp. LUAm3]